METRSVDLQKILGAFALLAVAGCASVSPGRIIADRMDYGQVIADSWKRQTLLNVVRLRYADAPVFLDVASVINSYSVGGKASAGASLQSGALSDGYELGAEGIWSNTPTVTYQPLLGDRFTRSLLQPIPPSAIFQLLQGGWPADLVMKTVVQSINGLRNDSLGVGADPAFRELLEALTRIQRAGGVGIRVEARKDGSAVVLVLRPQDLDAGLREDRRRVQESLGLETGVGEFEIAYGLVPRKPHEVAMVTRSMLELILELGFGIELPATHVTEGRATPSRQQVGDAQSSALARIRSGTQAPANAYTAIPYKGYWYWIDDTDIASKRIFTFLLILFSLAETGQSTAAPVVTVPSR
ncbi:MAG: hypothetical protein ACKVP2_07655 [Burkholderiales bacterium]